MFSHPADTLDHSGDNVLLLGWTCDDHRDHPSPIRGTGQQIDLPHFGFKPGADLNAFGSPVIDDASIDIEHLCHRRGGTRKTAPRRQGLGSTECMMARKMKRQ